MSVNNNNTIALKLLELRLKSQGITDYTLTTKKVDITAASQQVKLDSNLYLLANVMLDIPITAQLELDSPENLFVTSKTEYENSGVTNLELFTESIIVTLSNYGTTFVEYQLEFLQIIPTDKNE